MTIFALLKSPKIVAMYRIKNEARWIEKSLKSISDICSEILILDDGSEDNTVEICRSFKSVKEIHCQSNLPFDETRDKNILLKMALKRNPDFILTMDGDEILMPKSKEILFEELFVLYPKTNIFEFQFLFIWDKPNQYRFDGIYNNTWQKRLLRMKGQQRETLHFEGTSFQGNAHCFAVPNNSLGINNSIRSRVKILHYGNYDKELRQKKFKFYNKFDPNSYETDGYKHMISGKGRFSGPKGIEFRTLLPELCEDIS